MAVAAVASVAGPADVPVALLVLFLRAVALLSFWGGAPYAPGRKKGGEASKLLDGRRVPLPARYFALLFLCMFLFPLLRPHAAAIFMGLPRPFMAVVILVRRRPRPSKAPPLRSPFPRQLPLKGVIRALRKHVVLLCLVWVLWLSLAPLLCGP